MKTDKGKKRAKLIFALTFILAVLCFAAGFVKTTV